jgi:hypothetical protein
LIQRLPDDGRWASFRIDSKVKASGNTQPIDNSPETIKVAVVGSAEEEGVRCRWIEMTIGREGDKPADMEILKLLIPEEHLGKGKLPLAHIVRAWRQSRGAPAPKPLDDPARDTNLQNYRLYLHGVIDGIKALGVKATNESTKDLGAAVIECGLGKVPCKGTKRSAVLSRGEMTIDADETVYLHPDAPFGAARFTCEFTTKRGNETVETRTLTVTLAEHGRNAMTALPDAE